MHRASFRSFRLNVPVRVIAAAIGLAVFAHAGSAVAQGTAAVSGNSTTTDANASTLIPGSSAAPAPELEENRQPTGRGQGGGKRAKGNKNARRNDVLATRAASDPLEVRIAFRKAKTEALLRRPDLTILEREANAAATDDEKRAYLRTYYTQLYTEVRKIDPSPAMASHVKLLGAIAEQRYDPKRRTVGGDEDLVRGRGKGRNKKR